MIYKDNEPIARIVRRDKYLVRIIEGGQTVYHNDPAHDRDKTMEGMKLTAVDDDVILRFNSDVGTVSGVGSWPLQWSRGWEWHDVKWNMTRILLPHAGDYIWVRPKNSFFYPSELQFIQAVGRCTIEGYVQLFNPTGYCFPSLSAHVGVWPTFLRGDWYGELRLDGVPSSWNIHPAEYAYIGGLTHITSVVIPDDTDTVWDFNNYFDMVNLSAPKLRNVPDLQECISLREVWLPSASEYIGGSAFRNDTNLERVILPALSSPDDWPQSLFQGCSSLAYIRIGLTAWPLHDYGAGWVDGVAANGTFIKHAALPLEFGPTRIPTGWTVLVDTPAVTATGNVWDSSRTVTLTSQLPDAVIRYTTDGTGPSATNGMDYTQPFVITATTTIKAVAIDQYGPSDTVTQTVEARHALAVTALTAGSTVQLTCTGALANYPPSLEYSLDGATWTTLAANVPVTLASADDRMYLRLAGTPSAFWLQSADRARFTITGRVTLTGSVMSLLDTTWYQDGAPEITLGDALHGAFEGCGAIYGHTPEMPALTGAWRCYAAMFKNCTNITHADVGLTSLTSFGECTAMFEGCFSLAFITVHFTAWDDTDNATLGWVSGVSPTGVFRCPGALPDQRGDDHIPTAWDRYGPGHSFNGQSIHGSWADVAPDGIEVD